MNKLEMYKYKSDKALEFHDERGGFRGDVTEGFEAGFDACLSLELPIKFHKWAKEWPFGWKRNKEYQAVIAVYPNHTPEELYQYWIDNVYKIE